jgi:hypothetical protein
MRANETRRGIARRFVGGLAEKSVLPLRPAGRLIMPRNCTVCRHPQRQEIEADLQAGLPYRALARQYNVSKDAASRHRSHVSLHTTPAQAIVTKIMALLDSGETATTWNLSLLSIQETRRHFEELLRQLNVGIGR